MPVTSMGTSMVPITIEQRKVCHDCQQDKPLSEYYVHNKATGALYQRCRTCHMERGRKYRASDKGKADHAINKMRPAVRAARTRSSLKHHYWREYGLTLEAFDVMLEGQGNKCATCHGPPTRDGRFHVDHCHTTGKVRGLLCHHCNIALGHVKDDPATLQRMIDYLNVKR